MFAILQLFNAFINKYFVKYSVCMFRPESLEGLTLSFQTFP